ncbi:MAG: AraC family transcriptional regulator ligand-binding domain-containing protein [Giesbergeria sp.]
MGPGSFNVVSFILLSSATLRSAIGQLQEYQRLISDGGRFQTVGWGAAQLAHLPPAAGQPWRSARTRWNPCWLRPCALAAG